MQINGFLLSNVFVQINTHKGFVYLDKTGELLNQLVDDFPRYSVNTDGTVLINDSKKFRELKVSPKKIWANFYEPDSTAYVKDQFIKVSKKILDTYKISQINRCGIRFQLISPEDTKESTFSSLSSILSSNFSSDSVLNNAGIRGGEVNLQFENSSDLINLRINPVESAVNKSSQRFAIMFDFDYFSEYSTPENVGSITKLLSRGIGFINNDAQNYLNLWVPANE